MKYITFELENGDIYGLPLEEVAKARAEYYAKIDPDTTFQEEFDYVMEDGFEGKDWFSNNQNPEDFAGKYVLLKAGEQQTLHDRIRECSCMNIWVVPNKLTPSEE